MNTAKQKRPNEQRFAITFPSVPVQTLRAARKAYFAFRGVDYHFGQDYKFIFLEFNEHVMQSLQSRQLTGSADYFSAASHVAAALRRELVDAVVGFAAVNRGAVEVSESNFH
jgi:hypothetical protein